MSESRNLPDRQICAPGGFGPGVDPAFWEAPLDEACPCIDIVLCSPSEQVADEIKDFAKSRRETLNVAIGSGYPSRHDRFHRGASGS